MNDNTQKPVTISAMRNECAKDRWLRWLALAVLLINGAMMLNWFIPVVPPETIEEARRLFAASIVLNALLMEVAIQVLSGRDRRQGIMLPEHVKKTKKTNQKKERARR